MAQSRTKYPISELEDLRKAISAETPQVSFGNLLRRLTAEERIQTVAAHLNTGRHSKDSMTLSYPRMVLPLAGAYRLISDPMDRTRDREVRPGELYWVASGDYLTACRFCPRILLSITFLPDGLRCLWYSHPGDGTNHSPPRVSLLYHTSQVMSAGLRSQLEAFQHSLSDSGSDASLLSARALLAWCGREIELGQEVPDSAPKQLFGRLVWYIHRNLTEDLSREAVAAHFSIAPDYVSRLFHDYTHTRFLDFVRQERLTLACRLLPSTRHSIKEIAGMCGFQLPAYFIRRFREKYGTTPAVYRKQSRRMGEPFSGNVLGTLS